MTLQLVQQEALGINQEYLDEWIGHREDLGKPMTPRAIGMLTKRLLQYSEPEQERLICNAIEMGWKGVYWCEPPAKQSSRSRSLQDELTDRSWGL